MSLLFSFVTGLRPVFRRYYLQTISLTIRHGLEHGTCSGWLHKPLPGLRAFRLSGISLTLLLTPFCKKVRCYYDRKKSRPTRRAEYLSQTLMEADRPKLSLSDILSLLKPYILWISAAVITALVAAFINVKIPILLGDLINVISAILSAKQNDNTNGTEIFSLSSIKQIGVKILTAYLVQAFTTFAYISFLSIMGERVASDLRRLLFGRLLLQDIGFFDEQRTGELSARLGTDVQEFKSCLKVVLSQGLRTITQVGGSMVSLYIISPKMAFFTLSLIPMLIVCGSIFGSFLRKLSFVAQTQNGVAAAIADEAFKNIRTVRAFAMENEEMELYNAEVTNAKKLNELLGIGIGAFQGATNFFLNGVVLSVLYSGTLLISNGELDPGGLMSFLVTAQIIQRSLGQLSIVLGQAVKGWSAAARVFEFIHLHSNSSSLGNEILPITSLTGTITFDNVTFAYPSRHEQKVLENLTLEIPPGKIIGICGPSGHGKSTLVSLLVRFYEPSDGHIFLDGTDISKIDPHWLRKTIFGLISQEPVLFATSVKENIRYGNPNASDVEVKQAAILANADKFISAFPNGYDTLVGEKGVALSGGQKQRIAIARALLKDPPVLILDEATSALDFESEHLVQDALQKAMKGRTVILIAHRLSTIRSADCIVVLKDGHIAEKGTHDELIIKKGIYYDLVHSQEVKEEIGS